ncbi:monocopper oxidase-like protein SKU5 [Phalaenopsis equestris]|uniref:monocopper oxidase-like protein SKU5 n=1 Tax=Phalaenopsis equestris TaxID=78828 RepID=UPI0009E59542|nr:monocopper oxidase-like protein SKU5 [Phalaenopsis equestris]XP_020573223.1 monocopper oxidase-like protein SKU5 [Phalaenopsis equestris]
MARRTVVAVAVMLAWAAAMAVCCSGGDPYAFFDWNVAYMKAAPLGVEQQVISINGKFPGPIVNVTTNWNVVVNVLNSLDEPLLITWDGVQQRKNSWQDGVLGTNCPIPAGWNWTYQFQVKDQIGSFFYFPSINLQRASGGFGGFTINNREIIPVPFDTPHGDVTLFIGDWFNKNHTDLRTELDQGKPLGIPDGVVINGKGPYRYNATLVPAGIDYETINVQPGKTYRLRVHNVGIFTCLNFRIQSHNLLLAETEGSYTVQQNYTSLDIFVGQSYSFLVTMDQNASSDYYIVASARFVNGSKWDRVVGVALLHYSNSKGKASGPLPDSPNDVYDKTYSMNQARSIRWNVSASGARPNPQGSFRYGSINVTQVYVLKNKPPVLINGKLRATLNGVSYSPPETPLRLADLYDKNGIYKLDFPTHPDAISPKIATSVINGTYKGFMEIVFQNNDTKVQSYHLDGYSFFVVGMDYGEWTENSRGTYNKWDGVARSTIQVYPGAWTAILVSLDNVGTWNLRSEDLDSWYLGQETYIRVVNPESTNRTELPVPDNALYCGVLKDMQKPQSPHAQGPNSSSTVPTGSFIILAVMLFWASLPVFL